ncbi:major facilitator superfamily domain-containing protein [Sphaerosporella brunnea]|uniref:Major facilitator superfamily domain-containing protein n=1 Tax=Sphaerosporella brunnea TaxID=1250544 RepID=A0A5J5ECE1_9PEZI|nr:major facilitator superfamily domain-containing protein [Sphaerosporella brunnea]
MATTTSTDETAAKVDIESSGQGQTGVLKTEAIQKSWTRRSLWTAYTGMFLMCLSTSLDSQTTSNLSSFATSGFGKHSLLSTIGVIGNVLNAVLQPPIAKFADVFGRFEAWALALSLYILGYSISAGSGSITAYAVAKVFEASGNTGLRMLQQVFIADTSDLLNRALLSSVPDVPFLGTVWIGPVIAGALGKAGKWRWGFGMWVFITPAFSAPLLWCLWRNARKAKRAGNYPEFPWKRQGIAQAAVTVVKELDLVGMLLLTAGFMCLMTPLTLERYVAGGFGDPKLVGPMVAGGVCLLLFPLWEMSPRLAPTPIIPFQLFKNRTVMAGCLTGFFYFMAFFLSVQPYYFSYLSVARNLSATASGHLVHIFSFSCTVTVLFVGVLIKRIGRYKRFLLLGVVLYSAGILLMLFFRHHKNTIPVNAGIQVLVGIGGGFVNVPIQLGMQASVAPKDVACTTALFLTTLSLGGAVGSGVSGAVWSGLLKPKLQKYLPEEMAGEVDTIFGNFLKATELEWGSVEREAVVRAYDETMRTLLIVAVAVCVPMWLLAPCMKSLNLKLKEIEVGDRGVIVGRSGKEKAEAEGN